MAKLNAVGFVPCALELVVRGSQSHLIVALFTLEESRGLHLAAA